MADYPCDAHLARYQGPSTRLYLTVYRDDLVAKLRLSVCSECLEAIMGDWLGHAVHQAAEGYWDPPVEGEELEGLWIAPQEPRKGVRRLG